MRPAVYEQATQHWRRSGGRTGMAPIPRDIDEGLLAITIGQMLGVPALDVGTLPPQWIRNALIKLRVDSLQHERAVKAADKRRKKAAKPAVRGR